MMMLSLLMFSIKDKRMIENKHQRLTWNSSLSLSRKSILHCFSQRKSSSKSKNTVEMWDDYRQETMIPQRVNSPNNDERCWMWLQQDIRFTGLSGKEWQLFRETGWAVEKWNVMCESDESTSGMEVCVKCSEPDQEEKRLSCKKNSRRRRNRWSERDFSAIWFIVWSKNLNLNRKRK